MTETICSLRDVTFAYPYPNNVVALHSLTLDIRAGEQVAICGPSGSGKSTLMAILGLLDVPSSGNYVLNGSETTMMNDNTRAATRARTIGFVFQAFHLLPRQTVEENVALSMVYLGTSYADRRERARECVELVGLAHRIDHLPSQLSGGERQRVAIARAIAPNPSLLLADEPTGNLDSRTGSEILDVLDTLHAATGTTIVTVTHDVAVAQRLNRVVSMLDGNLVSQ